jgi:hypothetical protein
VETDLSQRLSRAGERAILLGTRILTATLLTSFTGAIENWFYERFFAPEMYSAGPPFARAVGAFALMFPFTLLGLLVLGLPTAYLLRRARAESALSYAAVGCVTGLIWGAILGVQTNYGHAVTAFYGCSCALFWWILRPRV